MTLDRARQMLTRAAVFFACFFLVAILTPGPTWVRLIVGALLGAAMTLGVLRMRDQQRRGGGVVQAVAKWMLWSESRFKGVLFGTLVVVLTLGLVYGVRTTVAMQQAKYEADLAAYEESKKAESESGDSATSDEPSTSAPESSSSSSTTTPAADKKSAATAARGFVTHWLKVTSSDMRWVNSLRPYAADELVPVLSTTSTKSVPKAKLSGLSVVLDKDDDEKATASATLSDRSTVAIDLRKTSAGWKVTSYAPARAKEDQKPVDDPEWGDDAQLSAEAKRGAPAVKVVTTLARQIEKNRAQPKTRWLAKIKPYLSSTGQQQMKQKTPRTVGFTKVTGKPRVLVSDVNMGKNYVSVVIPTDEGHFLALVERSSNSWKVASLSRMPTGETEKPKTSADA
ncbi:hypothetical protein [Janibacter terrae]|uniref:hypothetical protein n=1 Tax=Janibacter terrae TaxID=103817 RepID=UPI000838A0D7|nr:hypothetical protein [Janibacter terrae]